MSFVILMVDIVSISIMRMMRSWAGITPNRGALFNRAYVRAMLFLDRFYSSYCFGVLFLPKHDTL